MSDVTNPATGQASEAASAAEGAVEAERPKVSRVISALKRHPLGWVVAIGAAAALVEIELAVGIIAGVGATALLVSKSGPEARQEVVAKGKAALERARVALAARRTHPTDAAAAPSVEPAEAARVAEPPATASA